MSAPTNTYNSHVVGRIHSRTYTKSFFDEKKNSPYLNFSSKSKHDDPENMEKKKSNSGKFRLNERVRGRVRRRASISTTAPSSQSFPTSPNLNSLTYDGDQKDIHRSRHRGISLTAQQGSHRKKITHISTVLQSPETEISVYGVPNDQAQLADISNHISSFLSPVSREEATYLKIEQDNAAKVGLHKTQQKESLLSGEGEKAQLLEELENFTDVEVGGTGPRCRPKYDLHLVHQLLALSCKNITFRSIHPELKLKVPDVDTFRLEDSDFLALLKALVVEPRSARVIHFYSMLNMIHCKLKHASSSREFNMHVQELK
ncbi:leucine-rich repeat receptor tyrosine kinase [Elysia marginata]|uniref:Leucine-rich repeat receptor tyrosine kinase n=1 Tax=Elysia marginata TaxID=1093978 RepID=A0AAV4HEL9_9GAST|nr:leucine-rich repeat receptor tyrosine kinase [Elysia marginata]